MRLKDDIKIDLGEVNYDDERWMESGSWSVTGFGDSGVEPSGSATQRFSFSLGINIHEFTFAF
jgi:hypothetical protein